MRESKKNSQEEQLTAHLFCLGASYLNQGKGRCSREVRVAAVGSESEEVILIWRCECPNFESFNSINNERLNHLFLFLSSSSLFCFYQIKIIEW
jgi:hypothetical protein